MQYIACGVLQLHAVLDISDPAAVTTLNVVDMSEWLRPIQGGTVESPTWSLVPPKPVAVTASGDRVYVSAERHNSVFVFEIDGLETTTIRTGELQTAHLEVVDDAAVDKGRGQQPPPLAAEGGRAIVGAQDE